MGLIAWIYLGLLVGGFARSLLFGRRKTGWVATLLFGTIGGLAGGFTSVALWDHGLSFTVAGALLSVLGAAVLLFFYGLLTRMSGRRQPA